VDELFSCRNCIHNASQSLSVGPGIGLCLKHDSVLREPSRTTCKYLHRKDLPRFVVDEGLREHAAEFAPFSALVDLCDRKPLERVPYSERYVWENRAFDPVVHALAQYFKTQQRWVFVQASAGGVDGRRALTHAGLVRRYMDRCGTWRSSYRLVLGLMHEIDKAPTFDADELVVGNGENVDEVRAQARWDVFFAKLGAVQEYGFHAGMEGLMWATDALNGGLAELDWEALQVELKKARSAWTEAVIAHAQAENVFFPAAEADAHEEPLD
jgi:hypothetical protein